MRYYFSVPGTNVFGVFHAVSQFDAQSQLMNSQYSQLYGRVEWIGCGNADSGQSLCRELQRAQ